MPLESLACPKCGAGSLQPLANDRFHCNHCGATSLLSGEGSLPELVGWLCPSCGSNNDKGVTFCGGCRELLAKDCPKCGSKLYVTQRYCSICGTDHEVAVREAEHSREDEERRANQAAVIEAEHAREEERRAQQAAIIQAEHAREEARRAQKRIMAIVVVVVVLSCCLLVTGGVYWFWWNGDDLLYGFNRVLPLLFGA